MKNSNFKLKNLFAFTKQYHIILSMDKVVIKVFIFHILFVLSCYNKKIQ